MFFFSFQEDLLIHGDSVYDIIDKQDHGSIQAELGRNVPPPPGSHHAAASPATSLEGEQRMFLCRMNVSRNARRQMRFGDQKVRFVEFFFLYLLKALALAQMSAAIRGIWHRNMRHYILFLGQPSRKALVL